MEEEYRSCDNCYYTYFDEKAYPCSLCIRGVERTDKWQPSRKTKADIMQTESTGSPIGDYRDGVGAWQTEREGE